MDRKMRRLTIGGVFAAAVIAVYAFCAYPFYIHNKIRMIREVYDGISEMTLSALEEEDEEQLRSYSGEHLNIMIADSSFDTVYSSRTSGTREQVRGYIESHMEDYQHVPVVDVQKNREMRIIRMRGKLMQEQPYYVYIRKELRGAGEMIAYTTVYLIVCAAAGLAAAYILARRSIVKTVPHGGAQTDRKGAADREKPQTPEAQTDRKGAADGEKPQTPGEQRQASAPADAARLARVQKEFVANVSHELKTPLAVISSQIEMLQNMGDGIDREYYFSSIREEVDKMSEMVGTLLDITTIENKLRQMEVARIDFSGMLTYMALKYDALFHKSGICLTEKVEEDCFVQANRMYLEQAVNNYIMNAYQHTAQGGSIRICLEKTAGCAVFSIYNDGQQIGEEDMEKIWENFYQSRQENGACGRMSNAGLGLYMVRKIVEQHKGQCGAVNKGSGVEFWLKLPLA